MGRFMDSVYALFEECVRASEQKDCIDDYKFDFDLFIERLKQEGNKEITLNLASRIIGSIDDEDESFLDQILDLVRSMNGYDEEDAFILHTDPKGITLKGNLPSNISLKINGNIRE